MGCHSSLRFLLPQFPREPGQAANRQLRADKSAREAESSPTDLWWRRSFREIRDSKQGPRFIWKRLLLTYAIPPTVIGASSSNGLLLVDFL